MANTYTIDTERIKKSFTFYAPKDNQSERYIALRTEAKEFAYLISNCCPDSREKSLAITKLEEAIMWANKAISHED